VDRVAKTGRIPAHKARKVDDALVPAARSFSEFRRDGQRLKLPSCRHPTSQRELPNSLRPAKDLDGWVYILQSGPLLQLIFVKCVPDAFNEKHFEFVAKKNEGYDAESTNEYHANNA